MWLFCVLVAASPKPITSTSIHWIQYGCTLLALTINLEKYQYSGKNVSTARRRRQNIYSATFKESITIKAFAQKKVEKTFSQSFPNCPQWLLLLLDGWSKILVAAQNKKMLIKNRSHRTSSWNRKHHSRSGSEFSELKVWSSFQRGMECGREKSAAQLNGHQLVEQFLLTDAQFCRDKYFCWSSSL